MTVTRAGIASLALLAAALVFGVVLGFVLAFGSSDTDSWEERWAELGVEEAEFVFLGDFRRGEREAIQLELKAAQVVFAEHFGAVTSDLRVYMATDLDLLNEAHARDQGEQTQVGFTCGGLASTGVIFMVLEACKRGAVPFADGDRDRTSMVIDLPWTRAEIVAEHCES